jgi:hypothetical protein
MKKISSQHLPKKLTGTSNKKSSSEVERAEIYLERENSTHFNSSTPDLIGAGFGTLNPL